ncbi:MAG: cysteine desulfurase NifS [Chloroflexi bacterium]|nr:MAG: cysteine desulfurase NifS [Chloroflexota bacterium]
MRRIYLDYAATTPTHPEVVQAMLPYFTENFGNPSSVHSLGQEASLAVEEAREKVAHLIGARPQEIFFTSGGTEANNLAIKGVALANQNRGNHIITTPIEHHSVLETCKFLEESGFEITYLPVDGQGLVDPGNVRKALTPKTMLISIMLANNEVGTIEPLAEIGKIAREAEVYFHTDAVQAVGHIPVDVEELGVDLLSASAHKLYGPKGIGALYIRKGTRLVPLAHGGEQESGHRAGTENVPGIVGFGKAAEIAEGEMEEEAKRLASLRDRLITGVLSSVERAWLNGHPIQRLPNNANLSFEFIEGESLMLSLDLESICVSTGSACSSTSLAPSHVLLAMGLPPEKALSSLRITLGRWTTEEDIEQVLEALPRAVARLRAMSPFLRQK